MNEHSSLKAAKTMQALESIHIDFKASLTECFEVLINSVSLIWENGDDVKDALWAKLDEVDIAELMERVAQEPERFGHLLTEHVLFVIPSTRAAREAARMPYDMLCSRTMDYMKRLGNAINRKATYGSYADDVLSSGRLADMLANLPQARKGPNKPRLV